MAASFLSPARRTVLLSLSLFVVTLITYSSVLQNSFVTFDDDQYLVNTPGMHNPFGWKLFGWAFTTFAQANWHPITWLSHALDYELFGLNPTATHVENVLIHAVSAVLLFLLLQDATGSLWRSVTVGALYALHPLNVESVVWAAERKSVLSMFFFMCALWAYVRYVRKATMGRYFAVTTAFALGLMAKPQIVTFPFVLLLWDVWPLNRLRVSDESGGRGEALFGALMVEKIPLFLLSAASSVVTWRAQAAGGATRNLTDFPLGFRLANAVIAYVRYLGKTILPVNLAVLYPLPQKGYSAWQIAACAIVLLAISVVVWRARNRRYFLVGWLWFLGTLVPMIGLIRVGDAAMADRYACLPTIGLFLMATWGVADWAAERKTPRVAISVATVTALVLLCMATYRQVLYWRNTITLWTHTLEVTGDNFVAQVDLASELVRLGRVEEAVPHFREAVALDPKDSVSNRYLGIFEENRGNPVAAVEYLNTALRYTTDAIWTEDAHAYLGLAYRDLHKFEEARENLQAALRVNHGNAIALMGMGLVAESEEKFPEAIDWYSRLMLVRPNNAVACLLLAKAFEKNRQLEESRSAYEEASRLPDLGASQQLVERMLSR